MTIYGTVYCIASYTFGIMKGKTIFLNLEWNIIAGLLPSTSIAAKIVFYDSHISSNDSGRGK